MSKMPHILTAVEPHLNPLFIRHLSVYCILIHIIQCEVMCDTCSKGDARFCQKALQPSAVIIADAVADTYATPSCVVVVGDLALRFV